MESCSFCKVCNFAALCSPGLTLFLSGEFYVLRWTLYASNSLWNFELIALLKAFIDILFICSSTGHHQVMNLRLSCTFPLIFWWFYQSETTDEIIAVRCCIRRWQEYSFPSPPSAYFGHDIPVKQYFAVGFSLSIITSLRKCLVSALAFSFEQGYWSPTDPSTWFLDLRIAFASIHGFGGSLYDIRYDTIKLIKNLNIYLDASTYPYFVK